MQLIGRRFLVALALPGAALLAGAQIPDSTQVAPPAPPAVVADGPPLALRADLSERELYIVENGEVVASYPVSVGRPKHPTPRGTFNIRKIVWNPAWIPPDAGWAKGKTAKAPGHPGNPMKAVKIFFKEPDYYIHGTGDLESLGDDESHGCLRMAPSDAVEVARWLMEHGGSPRPESWFKRILHFRSETKTVYLDNPIQIRITG